MKSKILIFLGLVLTLLLVISCAPSEEVTPTKTVEPSKTTEPQEPKTTNGQVQVIEPTTPTKPIPEYDEEIQELLDKAEGTTNYQYYYEGLKKNQHGSDIAFPSYSAYIKGNKIKKVYTDLIKLSSNTFYNEVYLDTDEKTAYGICSRVTLLCEPSLKKMYTLQYYEEIFDVTPLTLIEDMPYDVEIVGDATFADRQTLVLQYDQGEGFVKLWIDKYYGLLIKYEVYTWDDDVEVLQERHAFTRPNIDNLKNVDVNIPDEYELVE